MCIQSIGKMILPMKIKDFLDDSMIWDKMRVIFGYGTKDLAT